MFSPLLSDKCSLYALWRFMTARLPVEHMTKPVGCHHWHNLVGAAAVHPVTIGGERAAGRQTRRWATGPSIREDL